MKAKQVLTYLVSLGIGVVLFYGAFSFIDDKVGELVQALEASGQAENTVVVFCADHGEMLGERGMWFKQSFFNVLSRNYFISR